MSLIKVRENTEKVKSPKKSPVITSHARNAYIRTKVQGQRAMDDSQESPSEYAADQSQYMAEDVIQDAGYAVESGTRTVIRKGQEAYRNHRNTRKEEHPSGAPPSDPGPVHTSAAPQGETSLGSVQDIARQPDLVHNPAKTKAALEQAKQNYQAKQYVQRKEHIAESVHNSQVQISSGIRTQMEQHEAEAITQRIAGNTQSAIRIRGEQFSQRKQARKRLLNSSPRGNLIQIRHTPKTALKTGQPSQIAVKSAQTTTQVTKATVRTSYRTAKATAHAAKIFAQKAVVALKATGKFLVSSVKAAIAGVKPLISAIAAGGWVALLVVVVICLIGMIVGSCFGIFFSSEDTGSSQTMQEVVREINQEYLDKLDEIKAEEAHDELEMSGARAVWPEVLAIYAVKTTTDPDNPQEVASTTDEKIELLRDIFWAMNEIDYETDSVTETEIIESDDGNGNIVEEEITATKNYLYITVSHKTAAEMAVEYNFNDDQMEQLEALLADDNNSLWTMVLYSIDASDDMIVAVALSQVGNVGGEPYWSWYGFSSRVEWCACFVSWCANECGYIDTGVIPKFAGCINGVNWFRERGQWADNSAEPTPGMIIFFDWDDPDEGGQDGLSDHVGIVEKVENGRVYTIEGNSGDTCKEKSYPLGYYQILGYGIPAF